MSNRPALIIDQDAGRGGPAGYMEPWILRSGRETAFWVVAPVVVTALCLMGPLVFPLRKSPIPSPPKDHVPSSTNIGSPAGRDLCVTNGAAVLRYMGGFS